MSALEAHLAEARRLRTLAMAHDRVAVAILAAEALESESLRDRRAPRGTARRVVLEYLSDHVQRTIGEISRATGLKRPAVSSALAKALELGQVANPRTGSRSPQVAGFWQVYAHQAAE